MLGRPDLERIDAVAFRSQDPTKPGEVNNVDVDIEMAKLAENQILFEYGVKFINLPQTCTITIYTVSGTLVRKFRKDNDLTYLDWDLKNSYNVPIAGGTYIIHVEVPGAGETILKWFGVLRPVDLQNF